MKEIHTYCLVVDGYRRPSRKRNTSGVYLVGAKTPEEAKELLQRAIRFGSIECKGKYWESNCLLNYTEVKKLQYTPELKRILIPVKSAITPRNK